MAILLAMSMIMLPMMFNNFPLKNTSSLISYNHLKKIHFFPRKTPLIIPDRPKQSKDQSMLRPPLLGRITTQKIFLKISAPLSKHSFLKFSSAAKVSKKMMSKSAKLV